MSGLILESYHSRMEKRKARAREYDLARRARYKKLGLNSDGQPYLDRRVEPVNQKLEEPVGLEKQWREFTEKGVV